MNILGLDIGTSAVKAVVIGENGLQVAEASAELSIHHPQPGWSEQKPEDWIQAVYSCCKQLRLLASEAWKNVGAIGLSGQMHGATLLDKSQKPLRPAILWNDSRSAAQCEQINKSVADIEQRAGIFAMPGFTAPKVLWCQQNEPQTHTAIAHILLPKDYVRLHLTGELATDMADAAGTLWFNQAKRNWDKALCEASATSDDWLPQLVEGSAVSGRLRNSIAAQFGLPAGIPVAGGGGDAAAGALGIGAINEGDGFVSLGTSGQLFVSTQAYRSAPGTAVHCYAHCVPDRWFQMACMLNGASPMSWFSNFVNKPIADLLGEAEQATQATLFLPYLAGERTPHNDPYIRGTFFGLSPDTTEGQAMRGVVEGIAYSFCDALSCIEEAGTRLDTIAAIGGGTRSDFVLQTMADAMGLTIQRYAGAGNGPAVGAARLAMVACGLHKLQDVAVKPQLEAVFRPDQTRQAYHDCQLAHWRKLYKSLRELAHDALAVKR